MIGGVAAILVAGSLSLGLAACGSDDDGDSNGTTTEVTSQMNGTTGGSGSKAKKNGGKKDKQGGQITPGKKAPDSAGDKNKNAPDDAISDRPGGPGKPVSP
jgi:hypothetical protein